MSKPRYSIGDAFSLDEVKAIFRRVTGKPMPIRKVYAITNAMITSNPLRFEFEINRLRGYAWDQEEIEEMEEKRK